MDSKTTIGAPEWILPFSAISMRDLSLVGGKNASLGEMISSLHSKGIRVPGGFATTSSAYWNFLDYNGLRENLSKALGALDHEDFENLGQVGRACRELIMQATLPVQFSEALSRMYHELSAEHPGIPVAVRSSATAEDLPTASFAGQHDSFMNITGQAELLRAVQRCYASLFNDRAIKYREDHGFRHMNVALSVGIQKMVRSDKACSGVAFTIEPGSGFSNVIQISGVWGLGDNIVQGAVTPDEFIVFKPSLRSGHRAIVSKKLGEKAMTMVYGSASADGGAPTKNIETPADKRMQYVLSDREITRLAGWALSIEEHYRKPMDIEWAKDGISGELFIIQARPETVHARRDKLQIREYTLQEKAEPLVAGDAVGNRITSGVVRILKSPAEADKLKHGEILVTSITSPDWDPVLKKAAAIITDKGGRTSHASIVARELGAVAVVGTGNASSVLRDGQVVTVSCATGTKGLVYNGALKWTEKSHDVSKLRMPDTEPMLIAGDPSRAFDLSWYPNRGVGLMRIEFVISNSIRIHPMALAKFSSIRDEKVISAIETLTHHYPDKERYFVEKLAEGVATLACAFYPKEVIVRMSDFKTNEYANLIGGRDFEPHEENPMLGFRGASRYYDERYREGFRLECEAMKLVRDEMGLTNVKLMIPFCRTPEEGKKVVDLMAQYGLKRGINGLEIYVMAEIPSNVLLAEEFASIFDGFSIGSNDLTQLTLGIDRDSALIAGLFDENNPASRKMISMAIQKAKSSGRKIGLCGQAPSDKPEFARFLVEQGINSISFNPDALIRGIANINEAEKELHVQQLLF